jgi:dihydropteroate synthase
MSAPESTRPGAAPVAEAEELARIAALAAGAFRVQDVAEHVAALKVFHVIRHSPAGPPKP